MRQYLMEFVTSIFFIYIILVTKANPIAVGASLSLIIMLTKCHVNPAVTIVMAASSSLPVDQVIPYNVAQILGGLVALEIWKKYK
jgi:glycerol uptake facilitator-like aquaporin